MRSLLFLLPLMFVLSACASKPSAIGPGLQVLEGKDIRTAIEYLGYPDDKQEIIGDTVYSWGVRGTYTDVYPITDFDRGDFEVNGQRGTFETRNTSYISEVNSYSCVIRMATGEDNVIKTTQARSIGKGCSYYNDTFEALLFDFGISLETLENSDDSL